MKQLIITASFLFLSTFGIAQNLNTNRLDSLFLLLEQNDKFMGSIAVSYNGNTIYENTIGFLSFEDSLKSDHETKYRIGSISKMFTSVLILKAIEESKLKLNQKLKDFYPEITNSEVITIENMLNHSSGIHDFTRNEDYLMWNQRQQPKDSMLQRISSYSSDFEPATESEYSNSNFVLLTYILEDIYKKSFKDLLYEKITGPLSLKNTTYGNRIDPLNNEAYSYSYLGKWTKSSETDMSIPQGAGAIVSTPTDLNIFLKSLFENELISDESLKQMKTIENGFGLGLLRFPYNNEWSFGHTGGIDGFEAVSSYFPEDKLAISLLSNGVNFNKNDILLAVLGSFYGDEFKLPEFRKIDLKASELEPFVGTYSSEQIPPKITISMEENTLLAQATGQPAFPLDAISKNMFVYDKAGVEIEFKAETEEMILKQAGQEFIFIKE
ncbi:serine hydrolase domain-containing protein [Christiangramia sp. LLG6405-1]|uniref:serine hydrolase domain-containing protein n=1 Tax=Christiangramia sp. LLG6405-1 TaxID=3160832 RepID=UPI00386FA63E